MEYTKGMRWFVWLAVWCLLGSSIGCFINERLFDARLSRLEAQAANVPDLGAD